MNFFKKTRKVSVEEGGVKSINYKKYLAEIFLAVGIISLVFIIPFSSKTFATEEFWALNIGDKTVAVVNSETEANQIIENVKNSYTKDGAKDVSVKVDPAMSVEQKFYHTDELPTTMTVDEAVNLILTGTEEKVSYTVKAGDTLWSIGEAKGFTVDQIKDMNEGIDINLIKLGDKINLTESKPLTNVTTTQTYTSTETISYKTKYVKNSSLAKGTTKVKTEGANGKKEVTATVTMKNGEIVKSNVLSSKVIKKAKTKVVYKGTKVVVAASASSSNSSYYSDSTTYAGSGSDIANYALQFVGNPYVYGGSSLTNGADCSGFVMAVYAHFGISLPHDAGADRSYGRGVSLGEAQPGDLVCYYGHVGIYIGGGRLVHAKDYGYGICVDSVNYSSKPIMTIRRIVE